MNLKVEKGITVVKPADIANIINGFLEIADEVEKDREHLYAIGLNAKNVVIYAELVSMGTSNETPCSPKEIYRRACIHNATNLILAHNHPSGVLTPSTQDIEVTQKVYKAGKILGITVVDHVIVNNEGDFHSLKASGLIKGDE